MSEFSNVHDKFIKSREKRLEMPFKSFLVLLPVLTDDTQRRLGKLKQPKKVLDVDVPKDLQRVTYATLCRLQALGNGANYLDVVLGIFDVLLGITDKGAIMRLKTRDVLGVVALVQREMQRIADLFNSLSTEHTSEELQAGVESLHFGTFGIADWYAKRMGITDHEDAYNTPWQRIYECLRIDHEQAMYEQRLRKIYDNKTKRR